MKISVALCTYNGERYIKEQICSIFHQRTYSVDEIQIGDDGSTDNTIAIIHELNAKFGKIKLTINRERLGVVKNFENTVGRCKGEFICLADQDDIWLPNKLETVIPILENNPHIQACFTNGILIDEKGNNLNKNLWQAFGIKQNERCLLEVNRLFEFILRFGNVVTGATMVLKASCIKKILPLKKRYNNEYHDFIIARQLAMNSELYPINQELIKYRVHRKQLAGIPHINTWKNIYNIRDNILSKQFYNIGYRNTLYFTWNYYKNTINELKIHSNSSNILLKRCFTESKNEWIQLKTKGVIPCPMRKAQRSRPESICFFIGYTERDELDHSDIEYINELKRYFHRVIVLTNQKPTTVTPNYEYILLEDRGYDFGFLYQAINRMNLLYYKMVGFINNSNRLIKHGSLDKFFTWCRSISSLFCGLTDCHQIPWGINPAHSYHLQSHFLIFKGIAIKYLQDFFYDIRFDRFLTITDKEILRKIIIRNCEIGLTQYMIQHRVKPKSMFSSKELCLKLGIPLRSTNIHTDLWEILIGQGYPLIKKKITSGALNDIIPNAENVSKYI